MRRTYSNMIEVDRLRGHPALVEMRGYAATLRGQRTLHIVRGSVRECGILSGLVVVPDPESLGFFVVDGQTRLEAARAAGMGAVPCDVWEIADADVRAVFAALNTARHNFTDDQRVMFYIMAHNEHVLAAARAEGVL